MTDVSVGAAGDHFGRHKGVVARGKLVSEVSHRPEERIHPDGRNDQAGEVHVGVVMHLQQERMILEQAENDQWRCIDLEEAIEWPVRSDWRDPLSLPSLVSVMSVSCVVDAHVHAGTKKNSNDRCGCC